MALQSNHHAQTMLPCSHPAAVPSGQLTSCTHRFALPFI